MNPLVKLARVALPARWFCQRPFWRANVLRSAPKNSYSISSLLHRIKYIGNLIHFCSKAPLWRTILCAIERTLVGIRPPAAFFLDTFAKNAEESAARHSQSPKSRPKIVRTRSRKLAHTFETILESNSRNNIPDKFDFWRLKSNKRKITWCGFGVSHVMTHSIVSIFGKCNKYAWDDTHLKFQVVHARALKSS